MRRPLLFLTLLFLASQGCAAGLDFEELRNNLCEDPYFDVFTQSEYCTGLIEEGKSFTPADLQPADGRTYVQRTAVKGSHLTYAGVSYGPQGASVAVGTSTIGEDGQLAEQVGFVGFDYGIADADPQAPFATDVVRVTNEPPAVLASFAELGLLYVEWNEDDQIVRRQYFPGKRIPIVLNEGDDASPPPPHQRACSAGVCAVADGSICLSHADCGKSSYCESSGKCAPLPGCGVSDSCDSGLTCVVLEVSGRRSCKIRCSASSDCPHPLACENSICGGRLDCSTSVGAVCSNGRTCDQSIETCVQECTTDGAECGAEQACVFSSDRQICGPPTVAGSCSDDDDCNTGWAMGITTFDYSNGDQAVAIASAWEGLRFGLLVSGIGLSLRVKDEYLDVCALTDKEHGCFGESSALATDVVSHENVLYVAMSGAENFIGVSLVDVRNLHDSEQLDLTDDVRFQSLLDPETCPEEHAAPQPIIAELLVVDDFLIAIEGGILGAAMTNVDSRARIFEIDASSTRNFLREVDCIPLGDAEYISVTGSDDPSIWVVGTSEGIDDGTWSGEFQIFSMTGLGEARSKHIHTREIPVVDEIYQSVVPVFGDGHLFVSTTFGLTEYLLDLNAERE